MKKVPKFKVEDFKLTVNNRPLMRRRNIALDELMKQIDDMMKKCISSDEETAQLFGLDLDTWLKYCAPNAESPIRIHNNEHNCSITHIKALKPGSLEQCQCLQKLREYATYFYDKDKKAPSLLGDESD